MTLVTPKSASETDFDYFDFDYFDYFLPKIGSFYIKMEVFYLVFASKKRAFCLILPPI